MPRKPIGVPNLGNSCYAASLMQCLRLLTKRRRTGSLFELLSAMDKRERVEEAFQSFHAQELLPLYGYQQQDVHEAFLNILNRHLSHDRPHFEFIEVTQRVCKCRPGPAPNPSSCLSLAVAGTLDDALKAWTKTETLDEPCRDCHGVQKKRLTMKDPPAVIVLHLKLFTPSKKETRNVVYPLVNLDLTPLLLPQDEVYYELQAVIRHIGDSKDRGHYIAWVKSKNQWFSCSDHLVKPIDPSAHRNPPSDAGNPYLFFYQRQHEKAESFSWEELQCHITQLGGKPADMKPPPGFKLEPHKHQIEALQFMLGREQVGPPKSTGGFLCSDVGTGKSLEVAMLIVANQASKEFIDVIGNSPATLLVCPNSLVSQWTCFLREYYDFAVYHFQRKKGKGEISFIIKVSPEHNPTTDNNVPPESNSITDLNTLPQSSVVIISWDALNIERKYLSAREGGRTQKRDQSTSLLKKYTFWRMVLDEGHVYRSGPPGVKAVHRWYVTGTPILDDTVHPALNEFLRLFRLLEVENECSDNWTEAVTKPYILGDRKPLISLLREYMWTHSIQNLNLPDVESHSRDIFLNEIEFNTYLTAKSLNHTRRILNRLCNHLEASEQENAIAVLRVHQARLQDMELKLYPSIIEFGKHCSPERSSEARELVEGAVADLANNSGRMKPIWSAIWSLHQCLNNSKSSSTTSPSKLLQPILSSYAKTASKATTEDPPYSTKLASVDEHLQKIRRHCATKTQGGRKRRRQATNIWGFVEGWHGWLKEELSKNLLHIIAVHPKDQETKEINNRHVETMYDALPGIARTNTTQKQFQDGFRLCLDHLNSTKTLKPKASATAAIDSLRRLWDLHEEITDSHVNRLCQHCLVFDPSIEQKAEEGIASSWEQVQVMSAEYQQKLVKFVEFLKCPCGAELDITGKLKRDDFGTVYCGKCVKSPKINFEIPGCLTKKKKKGEAEKYQLSKTRMDYLATQSSSKCKAVRELLEDLKEKQPSAKVLCFSHHPLLLDQLQQKLKYVTVALDLGGCITDATLQEFKQASGFRVLALPYGSGHCGLDLSISSIAVLCEPTLWIWEKQAEGRIRRIGQPVDKVHVYHLYAKNTLEEELVKAHQNRFSDPETESEDSDDDVTDDTEDDGFGSPFRLSESLRHDSTYSLPVGPSLPPSRPVRPSVPLSPQVIWQERSPATPQAYRLTNEVSKAQVAGSINEASSEAEVVAWLRSWLPPSDKLPERDVLISQFEFLDGKTLLFMDETDKATVLQLQAIFDSVLLQPHHRLILPLKFLSELKQAKTALSKK